MASAPIIEVRSKDSPYAVITSLSYAQSALGGNNLPVLGGENSNLVYFRIYNNYVGSAGIAELDNVYITVFDDADPNSHTAAKSPVSQSWVRVYETGFGENSTAPGIYTAWIGEDTAVGRSGVDQYIPEYGSDGSTNPRIRAGSDNNGCGFIEFASYLEVPDGAGFMTYSFAVSFVYDWII
jgi:hypothetical protein